MNHVHFKIYMNAGVMCSEKYPTLEQAREHVTFDHKNFPADMLDTIEIDPIEACPTNGVDCYE